MSWFDSITDLFSSSSHESTEDLYGKDFWGKDAATDPKYGRYGSHEFGSSVRQMDEMQADPHYYDPVDWNKPPAQIPEVPHNAWDTHFGKAEKTGNKEYDDADKAREEMQDQIRARMKVKQRFGF